MKPSITLLKNNLNHILHDNSQRIDPLIPTKYSEILTASIDALIDILSNSETLASLVLEMFEKDSYTYQHSINVAALSAVTANSLGYKSNDVINIAIGGFLHDIGKLLVEPSIITKPCRLTEDEKSIIEQHPQLGYDIIKEIDALSYTSKLIVLLHHEKLDGSGYPCHIKGIEIPEYVRIVTMCDMYDAMTTNRVYRQQMPVYTALEVLMTDAIYKIDQKIYGHFIDSICVFPPGAGVILSDGRMGIVTAYNSVNPSRPNVRVVDFRPEVADIAIENINLEENRTLFITQKWDVVKKKPTIF